ncbi:MAG: MFS transporter [Thermodesulfobacteriota bacterium]
MSPQSSRKWPAFLLVATGVFMSTLDSSMVNLALPAIMREFHATLKDTEWVVLAYLLTVTATLLFWGHLGDRLGRGRIYGTGMLVFGIGSLACAHAPTLALLIAARFLQALGAAMMMATGPAVIKEVFPREQLGRGLGMIGMAVSLGLMCGPGLGGILLSFASWRALFFITVPLGLGLAPLCRRLLPGPGAERHHPSVPLDWLGGLSWATGLSLLSLGLTHAGAEGWPLPGLTITLAGGGMALYSFLRIEATVPHPLLALELFRSRRFAMAILSATLSFTVLFAVIFLMPFLLDRVLGLPPRRIGLVMLAVPASILAVSPLAGWLADRAEARLVSTGGLALSTLGVLLLATMDAAPQPLSLAMRLSLLGAGQALFLSPNSASVLAQVARQHTGAAAALLATARNLGMLLGIAQAGLLFALAFHWHTNGLDLRDFTPHHAEAFLAALHVALLGTAAIGIIATAASWTRGNRRGMETTPVA